MMDAKRFVRFFWIAKVSLLAVLLYAGFEVATDRLHSAVLDPVTAREEPPRAGEWAALPPTRASSDYAASYRIGDAVAAAVVENIQREAVVLRYQGRPVVLKLRAGQRKGLSFNS